MLKTMRIAGLALLALAFCSLTWAQGFAALDIGPNVYQVNYYSNANSGVISWVRIINTGTLGAPINPVNGAPGSGNVCANIFVFDQTQEMLACCSCVLTPNDLLSLQVYRDLSGFAPLTGFPGPNNGVIKIVSSAIGSGGQSACEAQLTTFTPGGQLVAWGTHANNYAAVDAIFPTETQFAPANLGAQELDFLKLSCAFARFLGTGLGRCYCPVNDDPGHGVLITGQ